MSYFKKTNIFKQIFFSRGMLIVIIFLIIFAIFSVYSIIGKSFDTSNQRKIADVELAQLNQKQNNLKQKINLLNTPEGQAEILKEEYPVVATGERVVVLTDNTDDQNSTSTVGYVNNQKNFFDYLKNLFK